MAKQPETLFKERVLSDLRTIPNAYAVKIQQVAIRGTLDVIICVGGKFVALELKRSKRQRADPRQAYEIEKINTAGGSALVVHPENWPEVLGWLRTLAHAK